MPKLWPQNHLNEPIKAENYVLYSLYLLIGIISCGMRPMIWRTCADQRVRRRTAPWQTLTTLYQTTSICALFDANLRIFDEIRPMQHEKTIALRVFRNIIIAFVQNFDPCVFWASQKRAKTRFDRKNPLARQPARFVGNFHVALKVTFPRWDLLSWRV